jgi:hypothetical protein
MPALVFTRLARTNPRRSSARPVVELLDAADEECDQMGI